MANLPATSANVRDLINEYEEKVASIDENIAKFNTALADINMAATVRGVYVGTIVRDPYVSSTVMRRNLLESAWRAIYGILQIDRIASARDKKLFEQTLAAPPPLTFDTAKATFGKYFENPRYHALRGLAEVFAGLDPAYRSHSKVKLGVNGLPKRVVISGFGSYCSYGYDKLRDIVNALAVYRGDPLMTADEHLAIKVAHNSGNDGVLDGRVYVDEDRYGRRDEHPTYERGISVRRFKNGNAHVFFDHAARVDINRALAEFYGEVLPDIEDDDQEKRQSTAVAKDLQFYWSPDAVIATAMEIAGISDLREWRSPPPPSRVLEPSCGDGRIMDAIRNNGHDVFGIEVLPGRAAEARAKGHNVLTANFLDAEPREEFDAVVMNPPFYGRHYVKHVRHALKFLRKGGVLVSILPATAHYDHKELDGRWIDLPVGSFSAVGTNIPTGILKIVK